MRFVLPELTVALFAFLLNLPWEFLQVPFFDGMAAIPHWDGVRLCLRAAAGDALIVLGAFWITAGLAGGRNWIARPTPLALVLFVGAAFAAAMLAELLSVRVLGRWTYSPGMPVLPWIGLGLLPVAQWIVLPPLVAWLASRQLR